jgi:tRNA-splicing ligase RtcB
MSEYNFFGPSWAESNEGAFAKGKPIKAWTGNMPIEDGAMAQLRNLAGMPFIHKHVAVMPDVHWGMGATIGSVIATKGAIIPAAVGVDIGCGMMAVRTSLKAEHLPDSLEPLRFGIEAAVPHGRTNNGGKYDRGAWGKVPIKVYDAWAWSDNGEDLESRHKAIIEKHPGAKPYNDVRHLGTLGTGNHFVEICLDEEDRVWVMLHSGSRGAGNKIGQYFIGAAKKEMERWFIHLPDDNLAYVVEGSTLFNDYVEAVNWAQDYAKENREIMMGNVITAMLEALGGFSYDLGDAAINCHHNYVSRENHFGDNVLVTRKGAVRAREGDLGIIPGSMGAKSFIVRGRGNADSFNSCSHGAGRVMSRGEAKKRITIQDHIEATAGVECRKDAGVLDESPAAYKDIEAVMKAQEQLVDIVHTLKQVVCVKG